MILLDTNVIIEAVRIKAWKALRGGLQVETVEECRTETQNGSPHDPGYVVVGPGELTGMTAHPVSDRERAIFAMAYPASQDLHRGERDLMAHAFARASRGDLVWVVSSPDNASVRAAVKLDWREQTTSLEALMGAVGAAPQGRMRENYTERWLSAKWTEYLPGG